MELGNIEENQMDERTNKTIIPKYALKTSRLSITALILSISGYCTLGLTSVLSILTAIISIVLIKRNREKLKGTGLAVSAIVLSLVTLGYLILNTQTVSSVVPGLRMREVRRTLNDGRLAQLPTSAQDIKVGGWHSLFAGERYLKFRAEPNDIENFLANSPSIKGVQPEIFTSEHMFLPYSEREDPYTDEYQKHRRYFQSVEHKWFDRTIRIKGRRYEIPPERDHNWGEVIINDETNTVYINVVWS